MRLSKAEKERRIGLKELEALAHKIKKKNWSSYKGTAIYKEEFKEKRKPKKISDAIKGLKVVDKKLDRIIKDNVNLKKEIKSLKQDIKTQKELKIKKEIVEKPKSIMQLVRNGGGKIDPIAYAANEQLKLSNEKLKEQLEAKKKKENK